MGQKVTDRESDLKIDWKISDPFVTQKMLGDVTGLSRSGVRYIMGQLRAEGILQRVGSTKKGRWILKGSD